MFHFHLSLPNHKKRQLIKHSPGRFNGVTTNEIRTTALETKNLLISVINYVTRKTVLIKNWHDVSFLYRYRFVRLCCVRLVKRLMYARSREKIWKIEPQCELIFERRNDDSFKMQGFYKHFHTFTPGSPISPWSPYREQKPVKQANNDSKVLFFLSGNSERTFSPLASLLLPFTPSIDPMTASSPGSPWNIAKSANL